MKRILFIIPSLLVGGTTTSLSALYSFIRWYYQIDVFVMAHDTSWDDRVFSNAIIGKNRTIHAYNCNYKASKSSSFLESFYILVVKLLKRLSLCIHWDFEGIIYRRFAAKARGKYDIVVGYQEGASTRLASCFLTSKKIAWIHCDYRRYGEKNNDIYYYPKFDDIVCVSKFTTEVFRELFPELASKVKCVYNLLDYTSIRKASSVTVDDNRFCNDKFTILSVGRVCDVKRFDQIPSIAKGLLDKGVAFRWYVVGPSVDNSLSILLDQVTKYELEDVVIYLGNKSNPYPYFKRSNLLVSLSVSEACPMVFNEARVLELPVVSTDFNSAYEFIETGVDGIITQLGKMGDTLYDIISEPEIYNKLKTNVSRKIYNDDAVLSSLDELFT